MTVLHELIAPAPLAHRLASAIADLGLRGVISWSEAGTVLDALEHHHQVREDMVQFIAVRRFEFYTMIGGSQLTLACFRHKVRVWLETGQEV